MPVRHISTRRASTAAAALALFSTAGILVGAPAFASASGSNGTIKIGEALDPQPSNANDPWISCPLIEFSGFDAGWHDVSVTVASPGQPGIAQPYDSAFNGSSGDLPISLADFDYSSPVDGGYHVKITVNVSGADVTSKSKTVWVANAYCASESGGGSGSNGGSGGDSDQKGGGNQGGNGQGGDNQGGQGGDQGGNGQGGDQGGNGQGGDQAGNGQGGDQAGNGQGGDQGGNGQGGDQAGNGQGGNGQGGDQGGNGQGGGVQISSLKIVNNGPSSVPENSDLTYTLAVTTGGKAAQTGVLVTDAVPAGTTYSTCNGGISCGLINGAVHWHIGHMLSGDSTDVHFTVHVDPLTRGPNGVPVPRTLTNTGTVTSNKLGPVDSNPVTTTVTGVGGNGAGSGSNGPGAGNGNGNGAGNGNGSGNGPGTSGHTSGGPGTTTGGSGTGGTGGTGTGGKGGSGGGTPGAPAGTPTDGRHATPGDPTGGSVADPRTVTGSGGVPVQVLGLKETRARVTSSSLPFTGAPTADLLSAGLAAVMAGAGLLVLGNRRRVA